MIFATETGSMYEISGNQIRRLNGKGDPTPRTGRDGEWQWFERITPPTMGQSVLIQWGDSIQPPAADGCIPATLTSRVVEVV